ncbi:Cd(II)/Pb(II)-responsive transcriptional regulator [Microbulbifer sp. 2205BS26-8]|uniref:Cd(II)/Pb(II)-responsive transcriptional regulator n=1 Tax=Microbulbifer sp. 2205BS26-8 TaxID=3064386 RepID=UPI00273F07D6|nr:Cd(II)/Pb(II)-responsive transcriptional regulator [Microbulbifer sp. 2205BS26-8]MDP5211001.1 Cd(II)/Pb(II)-responsive transcriptional regulator [Microbulbifer sp. 2205BS26-8]
MSYRIGEAARRVGCKVETVRYYEQVGLLPEPARTEGNFRLYSEAHLEQLRFIRHCRSLNIPLEDIRNLLELKTRPTENCAEINKLVDEHIRRVEEQMDLLVQLRQSLQELRGQCIGPEATGTCEIIRRLSDCKCHGGADSKV